MLKKYFFTFLFLVFALISQNAFSQWTFAGVASLAGTSPSISVAGPDLVGVSGGAVGLPVVYLSTNGGANFTALGTTGLDPKLLFPIWVKDASTIFVANGGDAGGTTGGNAQYYKTTDGGATWTTIGNSGGTAGFFNAVTFSKTNPNFGVAQCDPPNGAGQSYYLPITTDGGVTWNVTNPPGITGAASAYNSIVVIDDQFYGFGLNAGASRVYITSNGGSTWNLRTLTGVTGAFISGFAFSTDKMRGLAASNTSLPTISRTTDGGVTWSAVNIGAGVTGYCNLKWIEDTDICYLSGAVGAGGVVKKSTDGGLTWNTMTTAGLTGITHMEFFRSGNDIYGYAIDGAGSILKLVDVVTNVTDPGSNLPTEYKLSQNYPNPFNPSTTINFSIPKASFVTLKVYNTLGKEVASIVSKDLQPGNYSEQFVASNLASGVYFYKLTAGDFSQTKKFILNK